MRDRARPTGCGGFGGCGNDERPTPGWVGLPKDHPGFADPEYRRRRDTVAGFTVGRAPQDPIPVVDYTPAEHELWSLVANKLAAQHRRYACAEYQAAAARLALRRDRIPQLRDVSADLARLTDFAIEPVPGLVPTRTFYGSLARRRFLSTQYVRHPSVPFYTPEPDIIHELIGHCNALASPLFAGLYEEAGRASLRARSDAALEFFSRVWWFSIEFGVVWEDGELRTYGAGLLSSFGELDAFRDALIRPFDIPGMGTLTYDITHYQPVLFAGSSMPAIAADLHAFFTTYDEDMFCRLTGRHREQIPH
jgi:phenylalanine-4-hydroxylase